MDMKKFVHKFLYNFLIFVFTFLLFPFFVLKVYGLLNNNQNSNNQNSNNIVSNLSSEEFRGIWFSFIEWEKHHGGKTQTEWKKTVEEEIIPNLKKMHINNIFVHAVAHSDAFFQSKLYPASNAIAKEYGKTIDYDPFKILVDKLCENSFKVHAWINPLRAMTEQEFSKIPDSSQFTIKNWYNNPNRWEYLMKDNSGRFWLNPSNVEVRNFVKKAVEEVLDNYKNLSGVHIDDYFYPSGLSSQKSIPENDLKYFEKIKPNKKIEDWRRESITDLVKQMHDACLSRKKVFGISPQGNMNNNFNNMFFDQEDVIKKGYVDYIMPQIYYGFENQNLPFKNAAEQWKNLTLNCKSKESQNKDIALYVGLAAYKCGLPEDLYAGSGKAEWAKNSDILKRQIEFLRTIPEYKGFTIFSYDSFFAPKDYMKQSIEQEKTNILQIIK